MVDTAKLATIGQVAIDIFFPNYLKAAYLALSASQDAVKDAEKEGLKTLEAKAKTQKILMDFQAHQARVAQEVAIAERIATSNEVVIQEFYEGSGKGHAGLQSDPDLLSVGIGGEGRRVVRRVIRFSGWTEPSNASHEDDSP